MDSYSNDVADTGVSRFIIYPKINQIFGPQLQLSVVMDAPSTLVGDIINVDYTIQNIGDSNAYNVIPDADYRDGNDVFYIQFDSGIPLGNNLGTLKPQESIHFNARLKLLKNVTFENLSIAPYVSYTIREEGAPYGAWACVATPNQINDMTSSSSGLNGQTIWMIVALSAIGIIAGESVILYRKIKML